MIAATAVLSVVTGTALAGAAEDHQRIRAVAEARALAAAESFAPNGARIDVEAAKLDPRLRLGACPIEPEAFDPPGLRPSAHLSIGVRCSAAPSWSLYVPVRVDIVVDVVVLAASVGRGGQIGREDLRFEPRNVAQLNGAYLTRIEDAAGMVLSHPLRPGTVLAPRNLDRPILVERGQRVRLVVHEGGLSVFSDGEALADAAEGDRVRVRNLGSRLIVEGVVDAEGAVRTGG